MSMGSCTVNRVESLNADLFVEHHGVVVRFVKRQPLRATPIGELNVVGFVGAFTGSLSIFVEPIGI